MEFRLKQLAYGNIKKRSTYADTTTKSTVEKRNVYCKGNAVLVLAGDAIIMEKSYFAKLCNRLNSITIEKVVEEDNIVSIEVEMAYLSHCLVLVGTSFPKDLHHSP